VQERDPPVPEVVRRERQAAEVRWYHDPADAVALRGIPCVGPGTAGGAIRGRRPGDGLFR
jgi:hypothetical protein